MLRPKLDFQSNILSKNFDRLALDLFKYQSKTNDVYMEYLSLIGINPSQIKKISQIPFLPIELYKGRKVKSGIWKEETTFKSSGTTSSVRSIHYIRNLQFYTDISLRIFEEFYGPVENYSVHALIPDFDKNRDSSLITMVNNLISRSDQPGSGFYFGKEQKLQNMLKNKGNPSNNRRLLIGLSYALLEFAENYGFDFADGIIMETGGMKGKRFEITRDDLHQNLKSSFNVETIHSEYGMAELTSQSYSSGDGLFESPTWMKIYIRDVLDPFKQVTNGKVGGINVIDLANIDTCSFIETRDLGRLRKGNYFEVLGRFDNSDLRGCNLLAG